MPKNFATPHCHVRSFDSASTPEAFALRELELDSGFLTVTDHGTLEANRQVYDLCQNDKRFKGKLTPILGLEGYFRDDSCPILAEAGAVRDEKGSYAEHMKYMHLTMHFMDQEAFETGVRILSRADLRAEVHGSERKPLFTWTDLEELGSKNVTFCSSCLIGMVSRHLLQHNDYKTAIKYYQRLRSMVKPGNFYVEMFPHNCDRNWDEGVFIKYSDGMEEKFPAWKNILTKEGKVKAAVLAEHFRKNGPAALEKHLFVAGVMENRRMVERPSKEIVTVEHREGFLMNECRPWAPDGDVQLGVNRFMLEVARAAGDKILISDDSHFAHPEEKLAQDVRLGQNGSWRFANSYHRFSNDEAWQYFKNKMGVSEAEFQKWVENSHEWGSRFKDFKFKSRKILPTSFYPPDTLAHTLKLIQKHGRMDWNNPVYVQRLQAEINLLHYNGTIDLLPYFFIDEEVCDYYLKNGLLTGPGRGSAAGLLLTYCLGITHVDPLRYQLSMDRFMTKTRIESGKYPDIDQDLPHRDLLVNPEDPTKGWLADRFGECVAQISTDTTMKLRSAIKDVFRANYGMGSKELADISKLTNDLPIPPQGIDDKDFVFGYKGSDDSWHPGAIDTDPVLQLFAREHPKEWEIVQKCLGMTRQKGRHACAYVIADEPISNFIPMTTVGGVRVTQFTASTVESSGGLKMDFLIVNSLKDIGACIKMIQDRYGTEIDWKRSRMSYSEREATGDMTVPGMTIDKKFVPHIRCVPKDGRYYDIWDLPEDQAVFKNICEGDTESVFQFDTPGARMWMKHFDAVRKTDEDGTIHKGIDSIEGLSAFTALDRPGGLDWGPSGADGHPWMVEFAKRAKGEPPEGDPALNKVTMEMLPETHGVIVYQEQLTKIYQMLGGTTGAEADEFRVHISKKQMAKVIKDREVFDRGAIPKLGKPLADALWNSLEAWARYGFNKSHAICYVVISYACAWLKHYYPLEWWTAVLRNADRNEINQKFWPHCGKYIDFPDIQKSGPTFEIRGNRIQAPLWLLKGIGDKAQEQLSSLGSVSNIDQFCQAIQDWRVNNGKQVEMTDKKTGELRLKLKLATTALNSRVVTTLIISGAMDSLFPAVDGNSLTVGQKITAYENASRRVGLKKGKFKETDIRDVSALEKYQMKKAVLPALTTNLIPIVKPMYRAKIVNHKLNNKDCDAVHHQPTGYKGYEDYPLIDGRLAQAILDRPPPAAMIYSVIGFVTEERRWRIDARNPGPGEPKTNPAVELTIDVEGVTIKAPKWPVGSQLPPPFDRPLVGSVVIACLNKRPGKGARIDDVVVVAPPLASMEEASPEAEE